MEVKKEGNPDVRRVVAQLLDYAAGLWGKTLLEFEQDVFLPYAEKAGGLPISLRVLLADKFGRRVDEGATDDTELQPSVEEIETALGENLLSGRFVLVVAAPVIPEPVRRVLDYMNAQGLRLYGLESATSTGQRSASYHGSQSSRLRWIRSQRRAPVSGIKPRSSSNCA